MAQTTRSPPALSVTMFGSTLFHEDGKPLATRPQGHDDRTVVVSRGQCRARGAARMRRRPLLAEFSRRKTALRVELRHMAHRQEAAAPSRAAPQCHRHDFVHDHRSFHPRRYARTLRGGAGGLRTAGHDTTSRRAARGRAGGDGRALHGRVRCRLDAGRARADFQYPNSRHDHAHALARRQPRLRGPRSKSAAACCTRIRFARRCRSI